MRTIWFGALCRMGGWTVNGAFGSKPCNTVGIALRCRVLFDPLHRAVVTKMDMKVDNGKVTAFRTRVALSFKYEVE